MPVSVKAVGEDALVLVEPTPLFSLKSRREELLKKLYLDLKLPRWTSPEIFVRYRPVEAGELSEKVARRENMKQRPADWGVLANADILIACCEGVYACLDGDYDKKFSLRAGDWEGRWTKFDGDLALAVGLPENARATDIVRAVYLTDGDLIDAANKLMEWSGQSNEQVSRDF